MFAVQTISFSIQALVLVAAGTVAAQPFFDAVSSVPSLSSFSAIYAAHAGLVDEFLRNDATTLLVPTNQALEGFKTDDGLVVKREVLAEMMRCHSLAGNVSVEGVRDEGLEVETLCSNKRMQIYINCESSAAEYTLAWRRDCGDGGSMEFTANITALQAPQGVWDGGRFYMIDAVLSLPPLRDSVDHWNWNWNWSWTVTGLLILIAGMVRGGSGQWLLMR
ncbi:hypothetical protein BS50DRAFT_586757 [Corynespora cassiicola Philippines]|uniref:FAS1 domain-containing protein n=1 Tax=Corynespora cassiicola Philippines TaxID=1448308 RepID=A0A2T2NVJ7_CORCC|nr:hypothetical protein BS50DRAFT_586757 [Corynespora cassiicola Philippines]